jgi:hypothetical protein
LLNGRTFASLEHLNEVTMQWLADIADVRRLRDVGESPQQRHERERPELLPLPACDFDTALVVYRHVNVEGFVSWRSNFYSVPWTYIGQVLPVRITESEIIIYATGLDELARHALLPGTVSGARQALKSHHPATDPGQRAQLLRQRFEQWGPVAVQFLDGLLAKQIQGKLQAQQLLALVAQYQRGDVLAALERACRFGAFSLAAVQRILAATAQPKPLLDELAELQRDTLDPRLRQEPIGPRPTRDYQPLLEPENRHHASPSSDPASTDHPAAAADGDPTDRAEPA